jgi:hypothetical protein
MKGNISKGREIRINLIIAEYNALTTRCTYIINLQSIILTVAVTWILIFVTVWDTIQYNVIIWAVFFGAQLIGWIGSILTYDLYNIVRYIESSLRPEIIDLIKDDRFWRFELYLKKARSHTHIATNEIGGSIFVLILFIVLIVYRINLWEPWDWIGVLANLVMFAMFSKKALQAMNLRSKFWDKV